MSTPNKALQTLARTFNPATLPALSDRKQYPAFWACSFQQQQYVLAYTCGPTRFNEVQSYRAAGYKSRNQAFQCAHKVHRHRKVQAAIAELLRLGGITEAYVSEKLGQQLAGADLADFQPFIDGKKGLPELREEGVNTAVLAKARVTVEKDGSEHRAVEVRDPIPGLKAAANILGMTRHDENVNVNVAFDFTRMTPDELRRLNHAIDAEFAVRQLESGEAVGREPEAGGLEDAVGAGKA